MTCSRVLSRSSTPSGKRTSPLSAAESGLKHPRTESEKVLRDLAFVYHLTRSLKAQMLEERLAVRS